MDEGPALENPIWCQACEKNPANAATVRCVDCRVDNSDGVFFCDDCFKLEHTGRFRASHRRQPIALAQEIIRLKKDFIRITDITPQEIEDDNATTIVFVDSIDAKKLGLQTGPKFLSMSNPSNAEKPLIFVSFIGPTGVGKSTLMKQRCVRPPFPLSGKAGGQLSTSSDLHAFETEFGDEGSKVDGWFIDSEGTGGTLETATNSTDATSETKQSKPAYFRIVNTVLDAFTQLGGTRESYEEQRRKFVHTSFPRLLYLFSDVICFVFQGSLKEKNTISSMLVEHAKMAAAGSVNFAKPPSLIIIFNKCPAAEIPYYDIQKATEDWFKTPDSQGLRDYYHEPSVVYIPVLDGNDEKVLEQVHQFYSHLQDVVLKRGKTMPRQETAELFQKAVFKLSKDPDAKFDFRQLMSSIHSRVHWSSTSTSTVQVIEYPMDIGSSSVQSQEVSDPIQEATTIEPPCKIANYSFLRRDQAAVDVTMHGTSSTEKEQRKEPALHQSTGKWSYIDSHASSQPQQPSRPFFDFALNYFRVILGVYEKNFAKVTSFQKAVEHLKARVGDIAMMFSIRNNINVTEFLRSNDFQNNLTNFEASVANEMPCNASTEQFKPHHDNVDCECSKKYHNVMHQSQLTYNKEIPQSGLWGMLFGSKTVIQQACHWAGSFEHPDPYPEKPPLTTIVRNYVQKHANSSGYLAVHLKLLQTQEIRNVISKTHELSVCVGCVLAIATDKLKCGHVLCRDCCQESTTCKVCNTKHNYKPHSIPEKAGYRILSLDGGGLRGVVSVVVLRKIEELLFNIPVTSLFDYIIGTSAGGIIALALTAKSLTPSRIEELFKQLGASAFKPVLFANVPVLGLAVQFFRGHKYEREALHKALISELGEQPIFGSSNSALVAVVSARSCHAGLQPVIFTSYKHPIFDNDPEIIPEAPLYVAAEASSAAGLYFPVFDWNYDRYTDGGMLNNNPAELGFRETARIWPKSKIDLVASLGTGEWSDKKSQLKADTISFLKLVSDLITNSENIWTRVKLHFDTSASFRTVRINPKLKQNYALDDKRHNEMVRDTREWLQHTPPELLTLCSRSLASYFVMDENQTDPTIIKGTIFSRADLPFDLQRKIQDTPRPFLLQKEITTPDGIRLAYHHQNASDHIYQSHKLALPVRLINLPPSIQQLEVIICCDVQLAADRHYKAVDNPISGCPFTLFWNK